MITIDGSFFFVCSFGTHEHDSFRNGSRTDLLLVEQLVKLVTRACALVLLFLLIQWRAHASLVFPALNLNFSSVIKRVVLMLLAAGNETIGEMYFRDGLDFILYTSVICFSFFLFYSAEV